MSDFSPIFAGRDNKSVFSREEFERWAVQEAQKARLDVNEKFLVEHYFSPAGRTMEAGTSGGRVLFGLQAMGYENLAGFDIVPEAIKRARAGDPSGKIDFAVMDASDLRYPDSSFDQVIYAGQVLCFIENSEARKRALVEACRVLRSGGVGIFTVLAWEERLRLPRNRFYSQYLAGLRKLTRSRRSLQLWPWLKLGGKTNWGAFLDRPPYVYWYHAKEFADDLRAAGFQVATLGTSLQIRRKQLCKSADELLAQGLEGPLCVVCRKVA